MYVRKIDASHSLIIGEEQLWGSGGGVEARLIVVSAESALKADPSFVSETLKLLLNCTSLLTCSVAIFTNTTFPSCSKGFALFAAHSHKSF